MNKFGLGSIGFPFTVFTDNQGRIVLFHLGEIKKEQADVLLGAVRQVNKGELTPEAARVVAAKQLAALDPDSRRRLTTPRRAPKRFSAYADRAASGAMRRQTGRCCVSPAGSAGATANSQLFIAKSPAIWLNSPPSALKLSLAA